MKLTQRIMILIAAAMLIACGNQTGSADEHVLVTPGKADNFFSATAQEYFVEGQALVVLEESYRDKSDDEKLSRVKQLVALKRVQIAWFLNQYLIEKSHDDSNGSYGGFFGMSRNGAFEDLGVEAVDALTYRFTFRQQAGGRLDMLSLIPTETLPDGKHRFVLKMGKVSNTDLAKLDINHEWYRQSPWSSWNPETVDAAKIEEIALTIWPQPRSNDAYLDYTRLFADGEVTMAIHFGWDYHDEYHLKQSRAIYGYLTGQGFRSPVANYEAYRRTSGPLTKTISANGKPVVVKIWLFWGQPGTETDPDTDDGGRVLEADMRESFKSREIIVFSGHSGAFYGFALANWRKTDEGDLDDSEIAGLEMPKDTYQLVYAIGCDTYGLGQAFFENPNKADRKNINVITTLSFSSASTDRDIKAVISAVAATDTKGNHNTVKTFGSLLTQLDNTSSFDTMFGVYGIDNNPQRHPYANEAALCQSCTRDSDCGGLGNLCTRMANGKKACTFACTGDSGCPQDYSCVKVASGIQINGSVCVPKSLTCDAPPPVVDPQPSDAVVRITEVLADPSGDANGDGVTNSVTDEFVELRNASQSAVDLSGWTISDGYGVRFTFPQGSVLQPGQYAVVFGGGSPAALPNALVFASNGLGLTNKGDSVTVHDRDGRKVDSVSYGPEGGKDRALVRQGDALVLPGGNEPFTPGRE